MYVPSSEFCCLTFKVHDSDPYSNTLSTVATNIYVYVCVYDINNILNLIIIKKKKIILELIN